MHGRATWRSRRWARSCTCWSPPSRATRCLINTLGLSSWIAVIVGIRRNRPSYALPWWLFAVGLCLYWMGDVYTYSYPKYILHHEVPFPSIGDAIYLTVYPALMRGTAAAGAPAQPARQSQHAHRRRDPDARAVAAVVGPADHALPSRPTLGLLPKLVSVAYPLGDIILLAAAIRLVLDSGPRRPAFYLLSASIVSLLVDGLRLRGDDPRQLIPPSAAARPRLDLLPAVVGRRRAAPLDGRAAGADRRPRGEADTPASGPAHRRLPDRPGVHPAEGAASRRLRPDRDHLRLDRAVRPGRHAHGRPGAPAGALRRPRAAAQLLRHRARVLRHAGGDAAVRRSRWSLGCSSVPGRRCCA